MSENGTALDDLVRLLDLEPIEVNIFRGNSPDEKRQRVFGGLLGLSLNLAVFPLSCGSRPPR